jgi:hypothetical protein
MCLSPRCKEGDGGAHTDIVMTLENLLRENQNPYASEELKQTVELSSLNLARNPGITDESKCKPLVTKQLISIKFHSFLFSLL